MQSKYHNVRCVKYTAWCSAGHRSNNLYSEVFIKNVQERFIYDDTDYLILQTSALKKCCPGLSRCHDQHRNKVPSKTTFVMAASERKRSCPHSTLTTHVILLVAMGSLPDVIVVEVQLISTIRGRKRGFLETTTVLKDLTLLLFTLEFAVYCWATRITGAAPHPLRRSEVCPILHRLAFSRQEPNMKARRINCRHQLRQIFLHVQEVLMDEAWICR